MVADAFILKKIDSHKWNLAKLMNYIFDYILASVIEVVTLVLNNIPILESGYNSFIVYARKCRIQVYDKDSQSTKIYCP